MPTFRVSRRRERQFLALGTASVASLGLYGFGPLVAQVWRYRAVFFGPCGFSGGDGVERWSRICRVKVLGKVVG